MARKEFPDKEIQLPEAELEVLACLYQLREAPARDVRAYLEPSRPLTHASVTTLLRRLESRSLVQRRKAETGKAYLYSPSPQSEETFQDVAGRMLKRVFRNDTVSMVSSLFGAKKPSRDELKRLRALVDDLYAGESESDDATRVEEETS